MGETFARHLALEAGIVVNDAHSDQRGWDLLFELPHLGMTQATMPLDRRPGRLVARVQVKSGDSMALVGRADGVVGTVGSIKLSNWEELIKWPQPAFYLVLDYEGGLRPQHAFLIHVGEDLIRKVLERLRLESIKDPSISKKLHTKTMQLTWTEADRISPIDGASLMAIIERHVSAGQYAYVLNKSRIVEEVGYAAGNRLFLKIQTGPQGDVPALNALADFAIGVRSALVLDKAKIFDNRFQRPFEVEDLMAGMHETRLELNQGPPAMDEMLVRLEAEDGIRGVESMCRFYDSALLFPWLPENHRKHRLHSDLFDIVLSRSGEVKLTLKSPIFTGRDLALESAARFAMAIRIAIGSPRDGIALRIMRDGEARRFVGFAAPTVTEEIAATLEPVLLAHEVSLLLQLDPKKVQVDVGRLVNQAQILADLHLWLTFETSGQRVQIKVEPLTEDTPEELNAGILVTAAVRLSVTDVCYLVGVLHGQAACVPDSGGHEWHLAPLRLHVLAQGVLRPGPDAVTALRSYSEDAERWMEANDIKNVSCGSDAGSRDA